jgi:hypothetical protein
MKMVCKTAVGVHYLSTFCTCEALPEQRECPPVTGMVEGMQVKVYSIEPQIISAWL